MRHSRSRHRQSLCEPRCPGRVDRRRWSPKRSPPPASRSSRCRTRTCTSRAATGRVHTPRGLTALLALSKAGVNVAAGADNLQDPFNLVGKGDPLETAALMVMAGHYLPAAAYASGERERAAGDGTGRRRCRGRRPRRAHGHTRRLSSRGDRLPTTRPNRDPRRKSCRRPLRRRGRARGAAALRLLAQRARAAARPAEPSGPPTSPLQKGPDLLRVALHLLFG